MDYTIVMFGVRASHFHTPSALSQRLFYTVLRAGHLETAPDYAVERLSRPGHDLLLCLHGRGFVRVGGKTFPVAAGQLAWIDCRAPHAHWADAGAPWELYWLRADGKQTRACAQALNVNAQPLFDLRDTDDAVAIFERIFVLLRQRPLALDAALHAAMAGLIALSFEARLAIPAKHEPTGDPKLHAVLARMRRDVRRPWRVEELAAQHSCQVKRVVIRNQRTRWGSCSCHGAISLNWRLIQLPAHVRDYIIVHELMHLRHLNHSPRFWAEVESSCPNYRHAEDWLKRHATQVGF